MNARKLLRHAVHSLYVVLGVVFIWRGTWVILDELDFRYFGGQSVGFAIALIIAGAILVYLHDHRYDKLDHF